MASPSGEQRDLLSLSLAATQNPAHLALRFGDRDLSYEQLWSLVEPWVERLSGAGLSSAAPRAPLALVARPALENLCVLYAAFEAHIPVLLLHPRLSVDARQALATRAGVQMLFDTSESRCSSPPQALGPGEQVLIATSGTTGPARIAILSRAALIASAQASEANLGWKEQDRWLLNLPYSHVGGLSVLTRCLCARRTVVIGSLRPDDEHFSAELQRLGVSLLSVVPTQLHDLSPGPPPSCVRAVLVGGAAAPPTLLERLRAQGWPLLCTYGLTEMASQVATQSLEDSSGCGVGRPLPHVELRLDAQGRIQLRGPTLLTRYLDSPLPLTEDGFFVTTDRGELTSEGELHIRGRLDNVLISGGENVSPEWVEQQLSGWPGLAELALLGIPDERWGSRLVLAVVVLDPRIDAQQERSWRESLLAEARRRLPHYAVPKQVVRLSELPKNALGKLDRRKLCAQVGEYLLDSEVSGDLREIGGIAD